MCAGGWGRSSTTRPPRSSRVIRSTGCVGGDESHVVPASIGLPRGIGAPCGEPRALVPLEVAGDARVAVDRGIRRRPGAEGLVAERVVEVGVRVHDPAHRPVEPRARGRRGSPRPRRARRPYRRRAGRRRPRRRRSRGRRAAAALVDAAARRWSRWPSPEPSEWPRETRGPSVGQVVIGNPEVAPVAWHCVTPLDGIPNHAARRRPATCSRHRAQRTLEAIDGRTLDEMRALRDETERFMLRYKFGMDEVITKLSILREEFNQTHDYNPIEHISSRLKSLDSVIAKMQRKGIEPTFDTIRETVTDIAGVRVTCSFVSDAYRLAELLTAQRDIRVLKVKDYIAEPKDERLPEPAPHRRGAGVPVDRRAPRGRRGADPHDRDGLLGEPRAQDLLQVRPAGAPGAARRAHGCRAHGRRARRAHGAAAPRGARRPGARARGVAI